MTTHKRTVLRRRLGVTRYVVMVTDGVTMRPDKTLHTSHHAAAVRYLHKLEREGFKVKFLTDHSR